MIASSARLRAAVSHRAGLRLLRLYATSRRLPLALLILLICAAGTRVALHLRWNTYGALQMPLLFETVAATVVAATVGSPFGDPESATGPRRHVLRLGGASALTAIAMGALVIAGTGLHLAGGTAGVLRNVAGSTGIGLLCAATLGAGLAWTGPTGYLVIAMYAQYTLWHGPAVTTPWTWPARPPYDVGAAVCAGLVFTAGMAVTAVRGGPGSPRRPWHGRDRLTAAEAWRPPPGGGSPPRTRSGPPGR
ncbi:hypothetical protein [Actinoallomurus rhizosphaericola]|uniref:hypothetical protein n=1 Tax=Actinoallomurus rhizosphaericola TaxID=2952536 RepID=UPI00209245D9|nr:hypothetical protein [Actinoallomurus rhizosphaericola]MCO5995055.1 hypothetical protein [Actinoallomurus rhizosphaericola]